jgi:hypothetical protein
MDSILLLTAALSMAVYLTHNPVKPPAARPSPSRSGGTTPGPGQTADVAEEAGDPAPMTRPALRSGSDAGPVEGAYHPTAQAGTVDGCLAGLGLGAAIPVGRPVWVRQGRTVFRPSTRAMSQLPGDTTLIGRAPEHWSSNR